MKKIILFSIIFGLVLTLVSWISVESVPCKPYCWGGVVYHGYPFKYYSYGMGDVVYGTEWLHGTISWQGLVLDVLFWIFISLGIIIFVRKTKYSKEMSI